MQAGVSKKVKLGQNLNPVDDATGVESIDYSASVDDLIGKVKKLKTLYDKGQIDADVLRYMPGMNKIMYQGQLNYIKTRKAHTSSTYTDMEQLEFVIELTADKFLNFSTIEICLPLTFRKRTNKAQAIDGNLIPVNNFFTHWVKDVNKKRYGDDITILPINKTLDIYRYSDAMLKHLPDDVLVTFQEDLLYSKKPVIIKGNANNTIADRRNHIAAAARNNNTDTNLNDRIAKFNNANQLFDQKYYRIPLKYLVDIGLVNLPTEFNVKFTFNLEKNASKLFETKAKLANLASGAAAALPTDPPDASPYFFATPYLLYEQLTLSETFHKYISKIINSKRVLRTGIQRTPMQKTFEINVGSQSHFVDFTGANRQFSFIEIGLTFDKSEQHNNPYDSYNFELMATMIGSVQLENLNNKYGELNRKYDLTDEHDKYLMYRYFVAWATRGGPSVGPLSQFAHNPVYKELIKLKNYYTFAKSDERLYVDLGRGRGYTKELEKVVRNDSSLKLTITLKAPATKKMRLRVVGYHQGEYMYSMTNLGLLVSYKDYGIVAQNSMLSTNV